MPRTCFCRGSLSHKVASVRNVLITHPDPSYMVMRAVSYDFVLFVVILGGAKIIMSNKTEDDEH